MFLSEFGEYVWRGFNSESPGKSNCPRLCLKAVAYGGGGKVDNTRVANRDLSLKCFVKRTQHQQG